MNPDVVLVTEKHVVMGAERITLVTAGAQGPAGAAGATGAAGPNEISTSTATAFTGLVAGAGGFAYGPTAAQARTLLGLGTLATQDGTFSGTHSGTSSGTNTGDQDLSAYLTAAAAASAYQPLDPDLTAIAALTTTSFGRSFLALADAAAGRTLIVAARTDGANTFTGTQTFSSGIQIPSPYGVFSRFYLDASNNTAYVDTDTDSTHAWTLVNRTSTKTALTLQGASGQSRPMLELQDSLGATSLEFGPTSLIKSVAGDLNFDSTATGVINFKYFTSLTQLSLGGSGAIFTDSNAGNAIINYNQAANVGWTANSAGATLGNSYHQKWQSANIWYSGSAHVGLVPNSSGVLRVSDGSTGYGALSLGAPTSGTVAATINLASGQTANALNVKDSVGTVIARVGSTGGITSPSLQGFSGAAFNLFFNDGTSPAITVANSGLVTFGAYGGWAILEVYPPLRAVNSVASVVGFTNHTVVPTYLYNQSSKPVVIGSTTATRSDEVVELTRGLVPVSQADGSAANGTMYYSTTAGKLVYKDSGGTVNNLY